MFPVAAAAKFSIVVRPFQSPLCAPGNLCHIVRGRAGPMSLIKVLCSASCTSTNKLPYILWGPVYSHTYLKYNHQCHSWVLSVWCQPAWEEKVSVEELPCSALSVRHFLDDSWYRRALPTVGSAILACEPGLMRNAADQGMEPISKQHSLLESVSDPSVDAWLRPVSKFSLSSLSCLFSMFYQRQEVSSDIQCILVWTH